MTPRVIFALTLLFAVVLAAISLGGSVVAFVDLPSLLVVSSVALGGALIVHPVADITAAFADWLRQQELDADAGERAAKVFHHLADFSAAGGVLGVTIGLIQMFSQLDDPSAIGPAMAVAILTLFYAVLFGELVLRSMAHDCRARVKGPSR